MRVLTNIDIVCVTQQVSNAQFDLLTVSDIRKLKKMRFLSFRKSDLPFFLFYLCILIEKHNKTILILDKKLFKNPPKKEI